MISGFGQHHYLVRDTPQLPGKYSTIPFRQFVGLAGHRNLNGILELFGDDGEQSFG